VDKKIEPRCGIDTRSRGSGHGYYFLLRKSYLRRTENSSGRTADLDRRAALRLITPLSCVTLAWWCRLWRLWSASDHAHQLAVCLSSLRSYYLSWFVSCFFGFGLCQSRRNICRRLQPSRLGSGRPNGSAYLSNASAVELHAPQNLRPFFPSTNSRTPYYHYLCHEFLAPISSAICSF
jgi:hypothetical protein